MAKRTEIRRMMTLMPSDAQIVQTCHVFIALTILFGLRLCRFHIVSALLATLAFAFVKEFLWDPFIEGDTWESSLWDFAWYVAGAWIGAFMLKVQKYVRR